MTEKDRFYRLASAMQTILRNLANQPEENAAALGAKAVERLYDEFPDLTPLELDAIRATRTLGGGRRPFAAQHAAMQ